MYYFSLSEIAFLCLQWWLMLPHAGIPCYMYLYVVRTYVQWNLYNADTLGTTKSVLITELS